MDSEEDFVKKGICPVCKASLTKREGCDECTACGWSSCGEA